MCSQKCVKYDDLSRSEEWCIDKNVLSMMICEVQSSVLTVCVGSRSGVLIRTC